VKKHHIVAAAMFAGTVLFMSATPAIAADVGVGINIGVPGVYVQDRQQYVRPEYVRPEYENDWRERRERAHRWYYEEQERERRENRRDHDRDRDDHRGHDH
jgi:hypothetical protein